jgi:hypothetical protein
MDGNENDNINQVIEDDLDFFDVLLDSIAINAVSFNDKTLCPRPSRTSALSGAEYARELLNCGHDTRIREVLRMKKSTFDALLAWASHKDLIKTSKNIAQEEQFLMF